LAALSAASAACGNLLGLEPPPTGDAGADSAPPFDATTGDSPVGDAPGPEHDGGADADASVDGLCLPLDAGDGSATYYTISPVVIDDAGTHNWQYFEPSSVNTLSRDFQGAVFDGQYVYFAPSGSGTVTRYDTHGGFTSFASWVTFDTTALGPTAQGFNGAVYDGRYVYFVPYHTAAAGYVGLLVRFDTQGTFTGADAGASWSTFDLASLPVPDGGALVGFASGVYDGNFVYLMPYFNGVERASLVVRYDPDGGIPTGDAGSRDGGDSGARDGGDAGEGGPPVFAVASQFSMFDVSTRSDNAAGFYGGVFDGRYVYTVPYENNVGVDGVLVRYDTETSFLTATAWTPFDMATINATAEGFTGATFDGRYIYFVPKFKTVTARYDTLATSLGSKSSWSIYDLSTVTPADAGTPSFAGGAFDGRFVYFIPGTTSAQPLGSVVRYDSWSDFSSACAWSTHDVSQDIAVATNYFGAVFDGQYLYLVPKGTWVARFEAKTPRAMPTLPGFNGSFY
ncbi:MAG TPA: hypothetical protein VIJ22_12045, partial [Polyangiaceae bacterium]